MKELNSIQDVLSHVAKPPQKKAHEKAKINFKGVDFIVTYDYHPEIKSSDYDSPGMPEYVEIIDIVHGEDSFMEVFEYDLPEFEEKILEK